MVANINSANLTNLYNLYAFNVNSNKTPNQIGAKIEKEVPINDFFQQCINDGIDTLEEYNTEEEIYCRANGINRSEFNFNDYMTSRGCQNSEELRILDSIKVATKKDLINYVKSMIADNFQSMDYGNTSPLNSDELDTLFSKTDLKDLADFYSATNKANSSKYSDTEIELKKLSAFEDLITKFSEIDDLDENLKNKLSDISTKIDKNIKVLEEKLKKEKEEEAKEKAKIFNNYETEIDKNSDDTNSNTNLDSNDETSISNTQKYNATLISNYLV